MFFILFYTLGVSTGYYKHFPFSILYFIKNGNFYNEEAIKTNKNYKGRNFNPTEYIKIDLNISDKTGIYVTYGQSHVTNSAEFGYKSSSNVYQFFLNETYIYQEPLFGVDGFGGSVWGRVGDKLVESNMHSKVIFINCGFGGAKIEDLNKGPHFNYLISNLNDALAKYGRIDGILFHQGPANNPLLVDYVSEFEIFLDNLNKLDINVDIFLAQSSKCSRESNEDLITAQNKIIQKYQNVYRGPNSDSIKQKKYFKSDNCHFSSEGLDLLSSLWVESINIKNDL